MAAPAGQAGRNIDWYVITEDADLTLRITSGLKIGEDRWGELSLNHPVAANRWLEFSIDDEGNLSARPCRRDIEIEVDGALQQELSFAPGDPVILPHNRLYVSDSFERERSAATPALVRCADAADSEARPAATDRAVTTESDLPIVPGEPTQQVPTTTRHSLSGLTAVTTGSGPVSIPLEDSVYAATVRTRIITPNVTLRAEDSIETALIPVDADAPFGTEELSQALQQPIRLSERDPGTPQSAATARAANSPMLTPAVTPVTQPARNYTYLWTLGGILILGLLAAVVVATNSAPATTTASAARTTLATTPVVAAPESRADSLMASVANIIAQSDADDLAAWEFAVRSYEYIQAQEPQNEAVRVKLEDARNRAAVLRAQQGISPTFMPDVADSGPARADGSSQVARPRSWPAPVQPTTVGPTLTPAQIEVRLDGAERRIASGEINNPIGISAASLILSVLGFEPDNVRAINLLNRAAEKLVAQADLAYSNGDSFSARNTLEEVFAFHPRHAPANQRWQAWTGSPGPATRSNGTQATTGEAVN
ncbi:MAG: hypothetical protein AAGI15_09910 [Pseudomonadota bacterium]